MEFLSDCFSYSNSRTKQSFEPFELNYHIIRRLYDIYYRSVGYLIYIYNMYCIRVVRSMYVLVGLYEGYVNLGLTINTKKIISNVY